MNEARPWGKRIGAVLHNAVLALVVLMAVGAVAAVASGNYQARPVLTGSMRPGLPVGGIVITKRVAVSSLKVRDVIVFHRPDNASELVVHRIIAINGTAGAVKIQTQGDDNPVRDSWTVTLHGSDAYRAQFSLPLIGYAAIWWHQPQTRTLALGLAGLCALAALLVLALPKRFRKGSPTPDSPGSEPAATSPPSPSAVVPPGMNDAEVSPHPPDDSPFPSPPSRPDPPIPSRGRVRASPEPARDTGRSVHTQLTIRAGRRPGT